jgi:transcriptional regulator with GAF, ATPase, and Fis domain
MNAIASQVSIALYNATLFESVAEAQQSAETRLQETIILQQLSQALAGTLVVNDVIDAFFQACRDFFEIDFAIFSLVDTVQQRVYALAGFNVSDEHLKSANHPLDSDDIMAYVIRTGNTEVITGWDPRFDSNVFRMEEMESWGMRIFMPITLRREYVGLVEVGFEEKTDVTVQETQVKLLRTLVDQAAIALESAQRYEASQKLARREQTIREITDGLRSATTIEELVKVAAEKLGQYFSTDYALVELGVGKTLDENGSRQGDVQDILQPPAV